VKLLLVLTLSSTEIFHSYVYSTPYLQLTPLLCNINEFSAKRNVLRFYVRLKPDALHCFVLVVCSSTGNDEMCNFYIMYYVDDKMPVSDSLCFTEGPPLWDWSKFENGLIDVSLAPLSASVVPGTDDFLAATNWLIADRQKAFLESDKLEELMDSIQASQVNDGEDEEGLFNDEMQRMQNTGYDYPPGK
jgi:Copper type II ascorbate-dependent monooxygenase, C-terminal domain